MLTLPRAVWMLLCAALALLLVCAALPPSAALAAPPTDERSRTTLTIDHGLLLLSWDYYCTGDYNQNGLVEVADLTPIGQHFGEESPGGAGEPFPAGSIGAVVDGNGDGLIGVSDITPIGQQWDCGVEAWSIYRSADIADWPEGGEDVDQVLLSQASGDSGQQRLSFSHELSEVWHGHYFWVRPMHDGAEGIASDPVQLYYPPPGGSGQIDVRVESDSCGPGGELGVRIFAPEAAAAHFPEGAPVAVHVAGGTSYGGIKTAHTVGLEGFIEISYYMPGTGPPGEGSDGVFDTRGQLCIDALRDVLRFALGELTDADGWTLQELTEANVLYANVGVVPSSNGGPLTLATLAQYGLLVSGLSWYCGFENPTCSQCVMPDAGPGVNDVGELPEGYELIRYVNPAYGGVHIGGLYIDYSTLAHDPFPLIEDHDMLYLERGGLDRFDVIDFPGGGYTADISLDGEIGPGEDWGFGFWRVDDKRYYSQQVIDAVWDQVVFTPGSEPAWLPTKAEGAAFWQLRDATYHYAEAAAKLPDLKALLVGTVVDHVQSAPNHPHLWQAWHGWKNGGVWIKLNPSPETLIALDPSLAGRTDLPDVAYSLQPADWSDPMHYIPEDITVGLAAGVIEVAELVQAE